MRFARLRAAVTAASLVACAALARPLEAQTAPRPAARAATAPRAVDIDRVVAVVGDAPILYSDVMEEVNARRSEGLQLPTDSAGRVALERSVLSEMIDAELLVQKAKAEKVEVTEDDLTRQIDARIRQVRTSYPTEGEYRQALRANGLGTPDEYRKRLTDQLRRTKLQEEVYQKLRRDQKLAISAVSDQELDTAYVQNRATLPQRPPW
jgi:peptidyl-prolyl cis-trans isomerase SurA